jgi:hypothetical protein
MTGANDPVERKVAPLTRQQAGNVIPQVIRDLPQELLKFK